MATIPRRMMFFWGGSTMSWLRYMTLYSFRKMNPTWEMELYRCPQNSILAKTWNSPEEQDYFSYRGADYLPKVEALGVKIKAYDLPVKFRNRVSSSQKSNFFKWDMLSRVGGWYSDMDILWTAPFESTYEWLKHINTVLAWNEKWFSIGLLASTQGNPFFRGVYQNGFKTVTKDQYQSAGVLNIYNYLTELQKRQDGLTGNYYEVVEKAFPGMKMYNLPMTLVYPWIYNQMDKVFKKSFVLPPETVGIHWYAGTALAQEFNRSLTEENCRSIRSTIGNSLVRVLDWREPDSKAKFFLRWLQESTKWCTSVVELGPMDGRRLLQISSLVGKRFGVEISSLYTERAQKRGLKVVRGDARKFENYAPPEMRDCVIMIDFIEHLSKEDGVDLIKRCQKAFRKIVLSTPEGPYPQDGDPLHEGQDEYQKHRSVWTLDELRTLGFTGSVYPQYYPIRVGYVTAVWERV